MISILLYGLLIRFTWNAIPTGPLLPAVDSYKVCIGQTVGTCTVTASVNSPNTLVDADLDVNKVWYAVVTGVNQYGESPGSNQVVVGKPQQGPTGATGKPSVP